MLKRCAVEIMLLSLLLALAGVGCTADDDEPLREQIGSECNSPPRIVRTEFHPHEGFVPFDVTFTVLAEDEDLFADCGEELRWHWDFTGDGVEDRVTLSGERVTFRYEEFRNDPYQVEIWVSDSRGNLSESVTRFVRARQNFPPVITSFWRSPIQGMLDLDETPPSLQVSFSWSASDAEGPLERIELDFGDGEVRTLPGHVRHTSHGYESPGTYHVWLTVYDQHGASARAVRSVSISVPAQTSDRVVTRGGSHALVFDDNDGQNWFDEAGEPYEFAYLADNRISLKSFRYYTESFSGASQQVELLGIANPTPNGGERMQHIAKYKNLIGVAGPQGIQIFDVNTDPALGCGPQETHSCFPGTPTAPVSVCSMASSGGRPTWSGNYPGIRVVEVDGKAFFVAPSGTGTSTSGHTLYKLRIDEVTDPANQGLWNKADSGACWIHQSLPNRLAGNDIPGSATDFAVDGEYAYTTRENRGLRVFNIKPWLNSGSSSHQNMHDRTGISGRGYYVDHVPSREVAGPLTFIDTTKHYSTDQLGQIRFDVDTLNVDNGQRYSDTYCTESHAVEGATFSVNTEGDFSLGVTVELVYDTGGESGVDDNNGQGYVVTANPDGLAFATTLAGLPRSEDPATWSTVRRFDDGSEETPVKDYGDGDGLIQVNLKTEHAILVNNRVAIWGTDHDWSEAGDGTGYLTASADGNDTVLLELPASRNPATWATIKGVAPAYARLPGYPGEPGVNPVVFDGSPAQQGVLARNNRCWNLVNAYDADAPTWTDDEEVSVTLDTAPLVFYGVETEGIVAYDATFPLDPRGKVWLMDHIGGTERFKIIDDYMFVIGRSVRVIDISDPYRLSRAAADSNPANRFYTYESSANFPDYVKDIFYRPGGDVDGVLVMANGERGLTAIGQADFLKENRLSDCELDGDRPNKCMESVPGLQMPHEGDATDIHMVGTEYALIAQKHGGVAIYDVSGLVYGYPATFHAHIRTSPSGNPQAVKVVADVDTGEKVVFIADRRHVYQVPLTQPSSPIQQHEADGGDEGEGHNCLETEGSRLYACWGNNSRLAFGYALDFSPHDPGTKTVIDFYDSEDQTECNPDYGSARQANFNQLHVAELDERTFAFTLNPNSTGPQIVEITDSGEACYFSNGRFGSLSKNLAYVDLSSRTPKKRLFQTRNDKITAHDIDDFEEEIRNPDSAISPPLVIGEISLNELNLQINDIQAVGPYLFVAAASYGAYLIDASDPGNMDIIGRTRISGEPTFTIEANMATALPVEHPAGQWVYIMMVADRNSGSVRFLRFSLGEQGQPF